MKAEITADDGSPVTGNAYSFDVFTAGQLAVPKQRIAVLDPSNSLKPFLRQAGIAFVEFDATTDRTLPVFVSRTEAKTPEQRKLFAELAAFIKAGGTAVYLQGGGPNAQWGVAGKASPLLPVSARSKQAVGTWTGIPHLVKDHPIFDGLPVNGMMGPIYENVWAENTLQDVAGETIVAAIGYDWFPDYDLSKRHYYRPGRHLVGRRHGHRSARQRPLHRLPTPPGRKPRQGSRCGQAPDEHDPLHPILNTMKTSSHTPHRPAARAAARTPRRRDRGRSGSRQRRLRCR